MALALAAAEDHLRAFASAALAVAEKFGGAAPPTRAVSSGGATDAAAEDLTAQVDPAVFEEAFGAGPAQLPSLLEANTVTQAQRRFSGPFPDLVDVLPPMK